MIGENMKSRRQLPSLFRPTFPGLSDIFQAFDEMADVVPARWRHDIIVDVEEINNGYILTADLPGVTKEDLTITSEDGVLTISCSREGEENYHGREFKLQERRCCSMKRSFSIPYIDDKSIKASLKNGVLTVEMNKITDQTKTVDIKIDE